MKRLRYALSLFFSLLVIALPFAAVFISVYAFMENAKWATVAYAASAISIFLSLALREPAARFRYSARRDVEYDEEGNSKSKGSYERLSKKERNLIDIQRVAEAEALVSSTAIKKMTKKCPKDPQKELDKLIGLAPVKERVREMEARMEFEKERKGKGKEFTARHMVFTGNPGSGKTTAARIITAILYKNGYISENKCVEVDGNFFMAGSNTARKTELVIKQAFGGVLFIDEAYALMYSPEGSAAIATIIKQMEDNRDKFVLILAGYTNEMKELISRNPGFESRIKEYIAFPDYNESEMRDIFRLMSGCEGFFVSDGAMEVFDVIVSDARKTPSFANGRTARSILDKAVDRHALAIKNGEVSPDDKFSLLASDLAGIRISGVV